MNGLVFRVQQVLKFFKPSANKKQFGPGPIAPQKRLRPLFGSCQLHPEDSPGHAGWITASFSSALGKNIRFLDVVTMASRQNPSG